jgi:hypothetical protein
MATTIVLKNSVTTTNTPSSLAQGEVAINVTDKKVWVGNAATTPVQIVNGGPDGVFTSVTDSGLTNTRVTYAGAGGLLKDSASITTDGTTITAGGFSGPHNGTVGATTPSTGAFTTLTATNFNTASTFGFKNRLINGGMTIDQRYAGTATANTISGYTLDRWVVGQDVTGKVIVQQNAGSITPPTGFINYLGITSQSAYTVTSTQQFYLQQPIEGLNVADLGWGTANAKTVTLSFQVYSSLTGTFGGALKNSSTARSYPFSYSISVANTWTSISVTIAGDTSGTWLTTNGVGIYLAFGLGVGSTLSGTAGAWAAANYTSATGATSVVGTSGATFYITGVQLETGSVATTFDYRDYGRELILCQRYYEKVGWNQSEVPGATAAYNGAQLSLKVPGGTTPYIFGGSIAWQILKRATPTILTYGSIVNATETSGIVCDYVTGLSLGATTVSRLSERSFVSVVTTVDSTVGIIYRFTVTAEL